MSNYDFNSLNDKEFESLAADLLAKHLGRRVERFKPGPDSGVDGRFFTSNGSEVIIQCKHWIKSGLPALVKFIEKHEAPKVRKLNPKQYILVTSLGLSRANKTQIKKIFAPYITRESDIIGNEDLNDLLSNSPEVERKHYKLWITSANTLQTILNSAIIGRSRHKLEEIIEESNRYVCTENHSLALAKLEKLHSIIITGAPGVGKTSLADQLGQFYSAKGFEFCFIENSLNEAEDVYREKQKQIFYFDDFLGRNFLLALSSHQDSHIINFIKRIERDKNKRFILTSRSNILNQGKRLSDLFDIKNIDKNEYELSISSLSKIDKAMILYNHIWFGQLDETYIDEIYKEKRYLDIISHKNFNPRIISFITDSHRLSNISPNCYWSHIESTLSNPKDIWRSVFDVQIDELSKHMVIAITLHGEAIQESDLKSLFHKLKSSNLSTDQKNFSSTIKLLVGALLNRNVISHNVIYYNLFNPSIADFVISNYLSDFAYIDELLTCLRTTQSIDNLRSLSSSKVIDAEFYSRLLESQLRKLSYEHNSNFIDPYKLRILTAASNALSFSNDILKYIKKLSTEILLIEKGNLGVDYYDFIYWAIKSKFIIPDSQEFMSKIHSSVHTEEKSYDEFISLSNIVSYIDTPPSELTAELKKQYITFLSRHITTDVIDEGILNNVFYYEDYDSSVVSEYVCNQLSELAVSFDESEAYEVVDCCDIDEVIESNRHAEMQEDYQYETLRDQQFSPESSTAAIHDLFDRQ